MGHGWLATSNESLLGSSHRVMGSTNGPVEKMQFLTAPTPLPSISALIGYAIPVRNIQCLFASGIGGNAITWGHTFSGGALISITLITSRIGKHLAGFVPFPSAGVSLEIEAIAVVGMLLGKLACVVLNILVHTQD